MLKLLRTDSSHPDFVNLVHKLDAFLAIYNGDLNDFYHQFNNIDQLKYVVLAYADDLPVACGAVKKLDEATVEVKRMFTDETARGKGAATTILKELEQWSAEMGYKKSMLETGKSLHEANRLYLKSGYKVIPNYGQYIDAVDSICYEKALV